MAPRGSDLIINNLRGGMNDQDPSHSLPDDQCVLAENVEFFQGTLGERRRGCESVTIAGSGLGDENTIVFLGTHVPKLAKVADSELWSVGATIGSSTTFAHRVAGTWSEVTPSDTPSTLTQHVLHIKAQSIHGKYFMAYKSDEDRLHVWDGEEFRRTGLAKPDAPDVDGDVGSGYTLDRIFRVRYIVKDGDDILRRSEPSEEVTLVDAGGWASATITKPSAINEGETDWELEASDGDGNFYVIATLPIATNTYTDTTEPATDYAEGELSDDIGDYALIPSVKFIIAEQDRLVFGGSWTEDKLDSRISWTPVFGAPGVGNDERIPEDTDNFIDLDWMDGGGLTGLSNSLNGSFYAFKLNRVYKIQRTGRVNGAYEAFLLSQYRGALPGSIISGIDEMGRGCVYFLDPSVGPARIAAGGGIQYMKGLRTTWLRVNTSASHLTAHGVYYPDKQQVHWWVAVDGSDTPNFKIISQVNEIRSNTGGTERGWSTATGRVAYALCSTIVPEITEDETIGSTFLAFRPYIGIDSPDYIQRCDTGSDDAGVAYRARIVTKPYIVAGLLNRWGAMTAALLATRVDDPTVTLDVKFIRDFGLETNLINTDFVPEAGETLVIKPFDNLHMVNSRAIQVEFSDPVV